MAGREEMNIANIFGLHLGCRVRCRDSVFTLTAIDTQEELVVLDSNIKVNGSRTMFTEPMKDCKILLKPLSKITDEDKAEFLNEFAPNKPAISHMGIECGIVYATYIDSTGELNYVDLNLEQSLWLATMGFDIGIVPDEYKEVEE